jgi:hypothetical protein
MLDKDIGHRYIKPRTRLTSKVERSYRIDAERFCRLLDGPSSTTIRSRKGPGSPV